MKYCRDVKTRALAVIGCLLLIMLLVAVSFGVTNHICGEEKCYFCVWIDYAKSALALIFIAAMLSIDRIVPPVSVSLFEKEDSFKDDYATLVGLKVKLSN